MEKEIEKPVNLKLPEDLIETFKKEAERVGWNQKTGFMIAMRMFLQASIEERLDVAKELFKEK